MRRGTLFAEDFLLHGIKDDPAWAEIGDAELAGLRQRLAAIFAAFNVRGTPNAAQTERDLIHKVVEALGWHLIVQANLAPQGPASVPDLLLFLDADAKIRGDTAGGRRTRAPSPPRCRIAASFPRALYSVSRRGLPPEP